MEDLAKISLTGDKSVFYKPSEKDEDLALAVDFLAAYASQKSIRTLELHAKALADAKLLEGIIAQAKTKMAEALRATRTVMKVKDISGYKVALAELEGISKKDEFPSRSRIMTMLQVELEKELKGAPVVSIGYGDRSISIRASKAALEKGFNANTLVNRVKVEVMNGVEAGGGHYAAAGMRVNKGFSKIVLDELLKQIEKL